MKNTISIPYIHPFSFFLKKIHNQNLIDTIMQVYDDITRQTDTLPLGNVQVTQQKNWRRVCVEKGN